MNFRLDVLCGSEWAEALRDGEPVSFATREDAETEARWSLDSDVSWRVVEVHS